MKTSYLPTFVGRSIVRIILGDVRINAAERELFVLRRRYGLHDQLGVRIRWFTVVFGFVGSFRSRTVILSEILTRIASIATSSSTAGASATAAVIRRVRRRVQVVVKVRESSEMATRSVQSIARTHRARISGTYCASGRWHGARRYVFFPNRNIDS